MNSNETKYSFLKASSVLVIVITIAVVGFLLSAGYGAGHSAICQQEFMASQAKQYQPSQVDVIYERTIDGQQDFLHLEIDTTYHRRGKANYTREVVCDRDFSLRAFDGSYHDCSAFVAKCFVENEEGQREWAEAKATKSIIGQECRRALATIDGKEWEAWYTLDLPLIANGAKATDAYKGLLLEVRDRENRYELKARYITQYIG